jgi:hypothetical protein
VTVRALSICEENAEPHENVRSFTITVDPGSDTPVTVHSDDGHEPPKLLNCQMLVEPGTGMFVGVYLPFTDQVKKLIRETVYRFPELVPDE